MGCKGSPQSGECVFDDQQEWVIEMLNGEANIGQRRETIPAALEALTRNSLSTVRGILHCGYLDVHEATEYRK
jgi:hypothetical protein